jgi:hypothetical protein
MFIYSLFKNEWLWSIFSFIMILIALIPSICRTYLKIDLPYLFDVFICLAFIFHMGNGLIDIISVYPIYNKFTHFFSAVVVSFIVLILLFVFNEYYRGIAINTFKILFDVVVITMAFGVVWEFMEWIGDFILDIDTQPSLNDTIGDLFADTLGGLFIACIGYFLIKRRILQRFSKNFKKHFTEIIHDD